MTSEAEQIIEIIKSNQAATLDDLEALKTAAAAEHLPGVEEIQKKQLELICDLEAIVERQ
jgi:hypothetical protein